MCDQVLVAEFQSLSDSYHHFDVTGYKDASGAFVLDEDFTFVGPFVVFKDGEPARFIGLGKRRILN